jgi:Alpha/beta hydrolase family
MFSLMIPDVVLIQGPMVGATGMLPLAERLRLSANPVHLPDVLAGRDTPPAWSDWALRLQEVVSLDGRAPVLVGYSASTVLAAELATRLSARAVIFLDGDIPPDQGPVLPGTERLRKRVSRLADRDGSLPLWSEWWSSEEEKAEIGITALARDPVAFEQFRLDQPLMTLAWFDDAINLRSWEHVPAGYIQLSKYFDQAMSEAERRGWPTRRIQGTHLHPVLDPSQTAEAIIDVAKRLLP